MTRSEQIKLSVAGTILVAVGILLYLDLRGHKHDPTVNAFQPLAVAEGDNIYRPVSKNNPANPMHTMYEVILADSQGQLHIEQFPNMKDTPPQIVFRPAPRQGGQYRVRELAQVSDACQKAIVFSCLRWGRVSPWFIRTMQPTPAQRKVIRAAEKRYFQAQAALQSNETNGAFRPQLLKKVIAATDKFSALKGDPITDHHKQREARRTMWLGMRFIRAKRAARFKNMERLASKVCDTLNSTEKAALAKIYDRLAKRMR